MKNFFPLILLFSCFACNSATNQTKIASKDSISPSPNPVPPRPALDTARYDRYMTYLSNGDTSGRWPVKKAAYPLSGGVLPYNRIVAYYGNLYSKRMGVLGEYPKNVMIKKLLGEVKKWSDADSMMPAIPALHLKQAHN